jgi:hypothetical protein
VQAPPWLGFPERLDSVGGWPQVAGGIVLGPFRDGESGDSIVKLKVVHPPDPDATVLYGEEGRTAMVALRFTGVVGFTGHKAGLHKLAIGNLVVSPTPGPDGGELLSFELLNPDGYRLLLVEAASVSVDAVEIPAPNPMGEK